jgi:hypothetical protein
MHDAFAVIRWRAAGVSPAMVLCFRRARVNLDFPWPTVIRRQTTR